jgi:hypothetical protein
MADDNHFRHHPEPPIGSEHYFRTQRSANITITVVKGEASEEQLNAAAGTAFECAQVGDLEGALGWRDPQTTYWTVDNTLKDAEPYWDDEFDADEHDLVVEYRVFDMDEETYRT